MEMIVRTKEDLEKAKKELPEFIVFKGEMAQKMQKAIKSRKIGKAVGISGGILAVAGAVSAIVVGVVAAPVTGGLSLGATALGIAGFTATIGGSTIVLTTAELAIVAGVFVSALGVSFAIAKDLLKHYDMEFSNGTVKLTRKH
jgi:hypothetical protein